MEPEKRERQEKTLDQKITAAQKQLDGYVAKKRKLEERGRHIVASLVLKTADTDPALARRIREIVDRGTKGDRDRAAIASALERLREAEANSRDRGAAFEP